MSRPVLLALVALLGTSPACAFQLTLSSQSFQTTPAFSQVTDFAFTIDIDAPLAPGAFVNPAVVSVDYRVSGTLEPGTPSGFSSFALQRTMTGTEFYTQGSSLSFEISPNAVLSDGLQVAELVGAGIVLTFNGREIDTGRFHPALLELNADGTGRIQNSNNVPSLNPLVEVDFGEEYITDLAFDPGNLTIVAVFSGGGGGGSSALSAAGVAILVVLATAANRRRRRLHGTQRWEECPGDLPPDQNRLRPMGIVKGPR